MSNPVTRQRVANVSLLKYARTNRDDGFFSDITIVAGKESIPANRLVLSCYSKYFETMFKSQMRERYENTIEIQTVEQNAMKALVDFIYVGSIRISNTNVMDLLSGADYLQLDEVKQFCFEFLLTNITPNNSLEILKAATLYRNEYLKDQVKQYITKNLDLVAQTDEFKALPKKSLKACIFKSNQKDEVASSSVYQAIVTWTKHDEESRKNEFLELFKMVKLENVALNFLEEFVLEETLVTTNFECQKMAMSVFRKVLETQKIQAANGSMLLSLGGKKTLQDVTVQHDYQQKASTTAFPKLPQKLSAHCALKASSFIYVIGGKVENNGEFSTTADAWRLNLQSRSDLNWEKISPMNKERYVMGADIHYDTLVVAGGGDEKNVVLASAEYYIAALNEWKTISPLNQSRWGNALVSCNEYLYALGGHDGKQCMSSIEKIRDLKGKWENVQPMQESRRWLAAVDCEGTLYAIGGKTGKETSTTSKTVEKYDSILNVWVYVENMNFERHAHAACVLGGKIYVVGGIGTDGEVLKEIECFDPANNKWSIVETINDELYHHALVAV